MAKPGQSSFRRILLSRLLLLSVPVLLLGVYVTYTKVRSTLLKTAGQNLTESAIRHGERIQESIAALQATLVTASETAVLKSGSKDANRRFINQLARALRTQAQCVQLSDLETNEIVASTCGDRAISTIPDQFWSQQQNQLLLDHSQVYVTTPLSENSQPDRIKTKQQPNTFGHLELVLSAPVYTPAGQLRYALSIRSRLLEPKPFERGSLFGNPLAIDQQGTILAALDPEQVGTNIDQQKPIDADTLKHILDRALVGQRGIERLYSFDKINGELLAAYTQIDSPITRERNQQWVIISVTPFDSALTGRKEIREALFILTLCLIGASFLATLYIARDLARPLEKLRDYALNESQTHSAHRVPHNFKIREFNQLAEALDGMISRLRDWAEELETAWKEAQAANQLKSEFLANTSHELRTPLNGIIGCLRLVRDGFCDDREEELDFLQRADDAAIHLLGIINDVLDIAKIEAGKLSVEVEPVDMRKLLDEVINLQAVPVQQKGLEFHVTELHEVIPVSADPAKLKQVLLNVVGNAVKFTESGSITIDTRIEPVTETSPRVSPTPLNSPDVEGEKEQGRGGARQKTTPPPHPLTSSRVVVSVRDTGIGIDPAQQHKLFRPFVMVDGSTTRKCGGTGLGLAISRNLMEMMGGGITLFSEGSDRGTTVEITLPTIEASLLFSGESVKLDDTAQTTPVDDTSLADSRGAVTKR